MSDQTDALDVEEVERTDAPEPAGAEQVAFDINDFPGGLRGAIEAVLMVVDEPVSTIDLASALEQPTEDVARAIEGL